MPTLTQVRDRVDAWLADKWINLVVPRQEQYAQNHGGRYWQGLLTHTAAPDNGDNYAQQPPDKLTRKPGDVDETWMDRFPELDGVPLDFAIAMDSYDGPKGKGFVGHVWVRYRGTLYHRAKGYGPEEWDQPWHQVDE